MVNIKDLEYELVFHVGVPLVNRVVCNHLIGTSFDSVINMVVDPNNLTDYYASVSIKQHGTIIAEKSLTKDAKWFNAIQ